MQNNDNQHEKQRGLNTVVKNISIAFVVIVYLVIFLITVFDI
jgi:hypothetical protein